MPSETIDLILNAKDQASSVIRGVTGSFTELNQALELAKKAVRLLESAFTSLVSAGAEAESADIRLIAALKRHAEESDKTKQAIDNFAESLMWATATSDEMIKLGIAKFINFGMTAREAMTAMKVAMDFAAGAGIDLQTAINLIAKAHTGAVGALSRYIGSTKDAAGETASFSDQLNQLQNMFRGAAQTELTTYAGRVREMKIALDEFKEGLAKALGIVDTVKGAFAGLADVLRQIPMLFGWLAASATSTLDAVTQTFSLFGQTLAQVGSLAQAILSGNLTAISYESTRLASVAVTNAAVFKEVWNNAMTMQTQFWAQFGRMFESGWDKAKAAAAQGSRSVQQSFEEAFSPSGKGKSAWSRYVGDIASSINQELGPTIDIELQRQKESFEIANQVIAEEEKDLLAGNANYVRGVVKQTTNGIKQSADEAKRYSEITQSNFGMVTDVITAMFGNLRNSVARTDEQMFQDFYQLFMIPLLAALPDWIGKIVGMFTFFDVPENDRMLINEGRRAAMFLHQGLSEGMAKLVPPAINITATPATLALAGGYNEPTSKIELHFHGPITDRSFIERHVVPVIEQAAKNKRSSLALRPPLATGRY